MLFWIISQPIKTTKNTILCNVITRSIAIIIYCLLKWTTTETTLNMSLFSSIKQQSNKNAIVALEPAHK